MAQNIQNADVGVSSSEKESYSKLTALFTHDKYIMSLN